ncbi:hypothetical protein INR49_032421 [Caranx melampygus]|nr:hypothetical protein INR49_032421 [Caranx melampygus]
MSEHFVEANGGQGNSWLTFGDPVGLADGERMAPFWMRSSRGGTGGGRGAGCSDLSPRRGLFCCNSTTCDREEKSDFSSSWSLNPSADQIFTFLMLASPFMTRQSSRSSSSSSSSMWQLCWSRKKHLVPSFRGSKGSTMMGSVPLISQRQNGQP